MKGRGSIVVAALSLAGACRRDAEPPRYREPLVLGGRAASVHSLEHGRAVYSGYCRPCHGDQGDGKGTAAPGLQPPARDLRLGVYKFAGVAAGQLPTDADFVRTIRGGLHGTAMQAWGVPVAELDDLIQYIKAFAPRWRTETAGEPIAVTPDPWVGREPAGIDRGKRVYHGLAQCAVACHPAYVTKAEIYSYTKELTSMSVREFRIGYYDPVAKDSDFGVKILPTDFTYNPLRAGESVDDIYRTIASGIGGTAMPTWKNVLPETDLWALAHYVRSLVELRGTPAPTALRAHLIDLADWTPPPPDAGAEGAEAGR
ncbi:MAG TPA: cytochrome c [Polyangia bacterium]|jgi:mono/diheme cytochrome c family protein|nr:cytochrome c [Polyangia bacterium]